MDLHLEKKKSLKLKIPFSKRNLILPSVNLPLSDNVLTIGFDTEFKQISEEQNFVLSYQYYAEVGSPNTEVFKHYEGILFSDNERLNLTDFVHWVLFEGIKKVKLKVLPQKIYLVCHFSVVDVSLFADFNQFKNQIDNVRRTFVSSKNGLNLFLSAKETNADEKVNIFFRDTFVLAPLNFKSLKALGDLVDFKKLEMTQDEIENMDVIRKEDPNRFIDYALRDAVICVKYLNEIRAIYSELGLGRSSNDSNDVTDTPITLTSIGVDSLLKLWSEKGIDHQTVLGIYESKERFFNKRIGKWYYAKKVALHHKRNIGEQFAVETYHGGRSETYQFGPTATGQWIDYDLCGAYTTAMASIGVPLWDQMNYTDDLKVLTDLNNLSFICCNFKFPKTIRYPSLPVRTEFGLIFPYEGRSYCGGPELLLAKRLGAEIKIELGLYLPTDQSTKPYLAFVKDCRKRRSQYRKETLNNMFWKEIGNSTYGKTAQGLRKKNVFDTRSGESTTLPSSKITNPFLASYITSLVRGVVSELLNALPKAVEVCNVTTDGFLCTLPKSKVDSITKGPLSKYFGQCAKSVTGKATVLEIKHSVKQVLGWRTRGQLTIESDGEKPMVLARGGIKPPTTERTEANKWILDQFLKRTPQTKYTVNYIRSIRSIYGDEFDATNIVLNRRLSMEYDWKCKPIPESVEMRSAKRRKHVFFNTVAWNNVDEFIECRRLWEDYRNNDEVGVIKTIEQFNDWWACYQFAVQKINLNKPTKNTTDKIFVTTLSRCFAFGQFGFTTKPKVMKATDFVGVLKQFDLPIKVHQVYNANTNKVKPLEKLPQFPPKKKYLNALKHLKKIYPTIEVEDFIDQSLK